MSDAECAELSLCLLGQLGDDEHAVPVRGQSLVSADNVKSAHLGQLGCLPIFDNACQQRCHFVFDSRVAVVESSARVGQRDLHNHHICIDVRVHEVTRC